jgi:hypothetical protein
MSKGFFDKHVFPGLLFAIGWVLTGGNRHGIEVLDSQKLLIIGITVNDG